LYKKVIPTYGQFDEWLTQEKNTQLFITSGLWIIGLPFRFLNPPVIDILKIN
jgi:predicted MPP superfamily phosphohydrolase